MNTSPHEREYRFSLPDLYPGREFSLSLRALKVRERNAVTQEFIGQKAAEVDDFIYSATFIAEALTAEPVGFENFPAADERPLSARAREYFLALGAEWEETFVEIHNRWRLGGRPVFFTKPSA